MRNAQVKHHSKYLESKQNKNTKTEKPCDTTSYVTPVTLKDELLSDDTTHKWSEGTICLDGVDESLLSQILLVEVRQFLGATDMYDYFQTNSRIPYFAH